MLCWQGLRQEFMFRGPYCQVLDAEIRSFQGICDDALYFSSFLLSLVRFFFQFRRMVCQIITVALAVLVLKRAASTDLVTLDFVGTC